MFHKQKISQKIPTTQKHLKKYCVVNDVIEVLITIGSMNLNLNTTSSFTLEVQGVYEKGKRLKHFWFFIFT